MNTLRAIWRWSAFVTVPVTLVFLWWGYKTAHRFYTFRVKYESLGAPDLTGVAVAEAVSATQRFRLWLPGAQASRQAFPHISASIEEAALNALDADLPYSGFKYQVGQLQYPNGSKHPIKLRYRGDYGWHWAWNKKSLRVKTKKQSLYDGLRRFNIVAPKEGVVHNHWGYHLAGKLGLVAPRSELVTLSVNEEYRGVHVLVEQIREMTLRQAHLMPGDVFTGELVNKDRYVGLTNIVFENPGLWGKAAENNHFSPGSKAPLERMIHLLRARPSEEVFERRAQLMDTTAFARFSAFEALAQTYHYDRNHNYRLYYDPARFRFSPIVWDPVAWSADWAPQSSEAVNLAIANSNLHVQLFHDAPFVLARQRVFEEFFTSEAPLELDKKFAAEALALEPELFADPALVESPASLVAAVAGIQENRQLIFRRLREVYVDTPPQVTFSERGGDGVALSVVGHRPSERLLLRFNSTVPEGLRVSATVWRNEHPVTTELAAAPHATGQELVVELPLVPSFQLGSVKSRIRVEPLPGYYELSLSGVEELPEVTAVLAGYAGDKWVAAESAPQLARTSHARFRLLPAAPLPPVVWQGEVLVEGVRSFPGDLIIMPGTRVMLAPGASVLIDGKLTALGTASEPIEFLPSTPDGAPWGSVALYGPRSNGSQLEHCHFVGGSGFKEPLREYSGMFNIHDAHDVSVRHCRFEQSKVVDDMVHVVYSDVEFIGCQFHQSLFDALDADLSRILVSGCEFTGSGNDALDLMGTEAVLHATNIRKAGDKGVSVGEDSRALIVDTRIEQALIGAQVKDASRAWVVHSDLWGNQTALDAKQKNWRLGGGGHLVVAFSSLKGNQAQVTVDALSDAKLLDTYVDAELAATERISAAEVDSLGVQARTPGVGFPDLDRAPPRFQEFIKAMPVQAIRGAVRPLPSE